MLNATGTIVLADAGQEMMENVMGHVVPYELFEIPLGLFSIPFTNHMFMGLVAAALVALTFRYVAAHVRTGTSQTQGDYENKSRLAQFFETICVFLRDNIIKPQLGPLTDKYIGYLWTLFFFILFCNVLGMIPIGAIVGTLAHMAGADYPGWYAHWWGTATGNLAITSALASISLVAIVGIGVKEQGRHFFAHFAPVPFTPAPMIPIAALLVVLEVLGLVIRCVVLAMRLFGVMAGGHLAIGVMIGMIFLFQHYLVGGGVLVVGLALSALELFIAVLQAFIFTFLTTLFIAAGAAHEHHEEHHELAEEGGPTHGIEPVPAVETA